MHVIHPSASHQEEEKVQSPSTIEKSNESTIDPNEIPTPPTSSAENSPPVNSFELLMQPDTSVQPDTGSIVPTTPTIQGTSDLIFFSHTNSFTDVPMTLPSPITPEIQGMSEL